MSHLARAVLLALLAAPSLADTWIVDDDGGPGVHFTDIQPAIVAAAPGDLVQVFPGSYSGFALDKSLVVFGGGSGVRNVGGKVFVLGIPAGSFAVLADLDLNAPISGWSGGAYQPLLDINACAGTVVVDSLDVGYHHIRVDACVDVRISNTKVEALAFHYYGLTALSVGNSRVEVVGCDLRGGNATDCFNNCDFGGEGGHGIAMFPAGGEAHVYRSMLRGGDGGDVHMGFLGGTGFGGDGGHGIRNEGAQVLIAGQPEHVFTGGSGGKVFGGNGLGHGGTPGCGLFTSTSASSRASGVTTNTGGFNCTQGLLEVPVPADPTLHALGVPGAGQITTFRVIVEPGSSVVLNLGRLPALLPIAGTGEDILIKTVRSFPLGTVGSGGVVGLNFTVPGSLAPGFTFFAQARVTLPGGETRYTNSVPVVLR